MRTIYIDNEYKCHVIPDNAMIAVVTDFFDGKCNRFVEGFRFIPKGETWISEDGTEFNGELVFAFRNCDVLQAIQEQYEEMIAEQEDMKQALEILEVSKE